MKDLRVVFMGTPEFAVPVLKRLIEETNVVLVVTQPDKEVGRKRVLTPSPVKRCAIENNIPVLTPVKLRQEYESVLNYKPDIIITCAYGQIVPKQILDYPEYECINVHASLLPKYRGASPIHKCIMDGETETGITIMYMDEGIDTGNIINARAIPITETDTLGTLSEKLSVLGADLLLSTLPKILDDTNFSLKQDDEESTYAGMIKRSDERLDFTKSAREVYNHVRSLNPSPLANTLIDGEEWKIISAEIGENTNYAPGTISSINKKSFGIMCADAEILVTAIKPFGKKEMLVRDFFNGYDASKLLGKKVGE